LRVPNSGLEVWLYDDANRETIRGAAASGFGGMPGDVEEQSRRGLIVGYSLMQDDDLDVAVCVGDPLTDDELSGTRWLEPQTAFLRLPSGKLCVESNDASRVGPEQPTEAGAVVELPAGEYRLTLYRIDHEALDRERLSWSGPQEVIVLTPGGTPADAAQELLPFEPRRDTTWVGKLPADARSGRRCHPVQRLRRVLGRGAALPAAGGRGPGRVRLRRVLSDVRLGRRRGPLLPAGYLEDAHRGRAP
jgi:hypothetical protein